jgi:hypothetical protein
MRTVVAILGAASVEDICGILQTFGKNATVSVMHAVDAVDVMKI